MEPARLSFRYTEGEYRDAVRRHFGRRLSPRRDLAVSGLALAGGLAMLATGVGPGWAAGALASVGMTLAALVVAAFAWVPGHWWRSQPKLHEPYDLVFSDEGIVFKTRQLDSKIGWSHYDRLVSDDRWHFLYYGTAFTALPKRAFEEPEAEARFVALARAHVGAPR